MLSSSAPAPAPADTGNSALRAFVRRLVGQEMFPFASRGRWCCSVGSCSFQVIDQVEKPSVLEGRCQVDQLTVRAARAAAALAPGNGSRGRCCVLCRGGCRGAAPGPRPRDPHACTTGTDACHSLQAGCVSLSPAWQRKEGQREGWRQRRPAASSLLWAETSPS